MSFDRENALNQTVIPAETIEFPPPAILGLEVKEDQRTNIQHLANDIYAKVYRFNNLATVHCYNPKTKESTLITDLLVDEEFKWVNSLCRDYFALGIGKKQVAIYGPNSTKLHMIVPPLPANERLFTTLQLLPNASGIVGLCEDSRRLMVIDLTDRKPTWKTIRLKQRTVRFHVLDNNTIGLTHGVAFQDNQGNVNYNDFRNGKLSFYKFELKKRSLAKLEDCQTICFSIYWDYQLLVSPSQNYFAIQHSGSNNNYKADTTLCLYKIYKQEEKTAIKKAASDFYIDSPLPVFTENDVLFYKNYPITSSSLQINRVNCVYYYDPNQFAHFATPVSGILFAASSSSFVINENNILQTYDYKLSYKFLETAKTELINQHSIPVTLVDIMLEYGFSLFSDYKNSQGKLTKLAKQLAQEILEVTQLLDQQEASTVNNFPELTARWEKLVIDRNALNHFMFLSKQLLEDSPAEIYEKVLMEFPKVSNELKNLFKEHLQLVFSEDNSYKK